MSEEDMGNSIRMWQQEYLKCLKGRNDNPEQECQVGVPGTGRGFMFASWAKPLTEKQQKAYDKLEKWGEKEEYQLRL